MTIGLITVPTYSRDHSPSKATHQVAKQSEAMKVTGAATGPTSRSQDHAEDKRDALAASKIVADTAMAMSAVEPEGMQGEVKSGIDALVQDHRAVQKLFAQYKTTSADDPWTKQEIVDKIIKEVSSHASMEERYVYPLVLSKMDRPAAKALYDRVVMDDQINKEVLNYLDTHKPQNKGEWDLYDATVMKFITIEEDHFREEEEQVLYPLKDVLSTEEQEQLLKDFHAVKTYGPSKPHPRGPSTAMAATVLHPIAGAIDRGIEALKHMTMGTPEKPPAGPSTPPAGQGQQGTAATIGTGSDVQDAALMGGAAGTMVV